MKEQTVKWLNFVHEQIAENLESDNDKLSRLERLSFETALDEIGSCIDWLDELDQND